MFVKYIRKLKSDWGNGVRFYNLIIFRCLHVFICFVFSHLFFLFIAFKQEKEKYVTISIFG